MYLSLQNYQHNTAPSIAATMSVREDFSDGSSESASCNCNCMRTRPRSGKGIDGLSSTDPDQNQKRPVLLNPYDPQQPYLYQENPLYAQYPYGPEVHVVPSGGGDFTLLSSPLQVDYHDTPQIQDLMLGMARVRYQRQQ